MKKFNCFFPKRFFFFEGSSHPIVLFSASLAAGLSIYANCASAAPPKAEVMHWWTSAGESAAVHVFADAFNKAGGQWTDNAIAGGETAIAAEISRVTGGNPPTAMQLPTGKQLDDLVAQNLLSNLDDLAAAENFNKKIGRASCRERVLRLV